jgi:hypothetical protein
MRATAPWLLFAPRRRPAVFVEFPAGSRRRDAAAVRHRRERTAELVNYRVQAVGMVVDRLLAAAEYAMTGANSACGSSARPGKRAAMSGSPMATASTGRAFQLRGNPPASCGYRAGARRTSIAAGLGIGGSLITPQAHRRIRRRNSNTDSRAQADAVTAAAKTTARFPSSGPLPGDLGCPLIRAGARGNVPVLPGGTQPPQSNPQANAAEPASTPHRNATPRTSRLFLLAALSKPRRHRRASPPVASQRSPLHCRRSGRPPSAPS